jgi:hypothetical protein
MAIFEGRKVHDEILTAPPGGMPRGPIVEVHFLGRDDHFATSSCGSEGSTTARRMRIQLSVFIGGGVLSVRRHGPKSFRL